MDALHMQEENRFEHRSGIAGKMHGCGHDGHTATLLAAAKLLSQESEFDGTVYFIFQPAEEGDAGAQRMIEEGLFERFPMEAVYGLHNIPGIRLGHFAVRPGAMMAGFDVFEIELSGKGTHAAMPQEGTDVTLAASQLVIALNTITSRSIAPIQNAVLSVTEFHAGSTHSVMPDRARLGGTVRYFDPGVQDRIECRINELAVATGAAYGAHATVKYARRYPATVNSAAEAELAAGVLIDVFGSECVDTSPTPLMASEDFSFMLRAKPGCYVWAGNGDGPGSCMVHNSRYDFNDELIPLAASYWVELVRRALPARSKSMRPTRAA
jgi:hippurate hydrolase